MRKVKIDIKDKNKTLFLFTDTYPYGAKTKTESYIENEVNYISKYFSRIYVFPINIVGDLRRIPDNVSVVDIHSKVKFNKVTLVFEIFNYLKIIFQEFLNTKEKRYLFNLLKTMKSLFNVFAYNKALKTFINHQNLKSNEIVGYAYWFEHWSLIISALNKEGAIGKAISRAHSFDLYNYMREDWFTYYRIKNISEILPVSKDGEEHLTNRFPLFANKIRKLYLGTFETGTTPENKNDFYTIVSCSSVVDLKRVHEIPLILAKTKLKINWIHFGDGDKWELLNENIRNLNLNITVQLMGNIPNAEVLSFYKNNSIDLFINYSRVEGLPVGLMEAASFGIKLIATDTNAVKEIVNENTGILVDVDIDKNELAIIIEDILVSGNKYLFNDKMHIKKYWNQNFNAVNNFNKLIEFMYL